MGRRSSFALLIMIWLAQAVSPSPTMADEPAATAAAPPRPGEVLDDRLRRLEAINQQILRRLEDSERERQESQDRYRKLEAKYDELSRKLEPARREPEPWASPAPGRPSEGAGREAREPSGGRVTGKRRGSGQGFESLFNGGEAEEIPLRATLGEGFSLKSRDDEYQLRVRVLDQTDSKIFSPGDQVPARSGLYIPRVRVYWEGQLTRLFEYEVSIQRSVEGLWDLLDGNVNIVPDKRFQVRFGRMLVPYSYDWYDHLEQYFITPERSLFPLNFGLSRSAGLMAHGFVFDDRLEYAVGGFDGHLVGLADNNTTRDAVGYLNLRPFLHSERFPILRNFNVGASGFLGQQVNMLHPLPLRTSIQSSENDEAAQAASSIFLKYNDDAVNFGGRSATALHMAWYAAGFSFEAEWQGGRDHVYRPGLHALQSIPASGNHFTLAYFLTGEVVNRREVVTPRRPFDPVHGSWGPGALEPFVRYSQLSLDETVFTGGFADPNEWTRSIDLVDLGLNWYLTKYIKIYFDWQHSMYGSPVLLNPTKELYGRTNDLFWIRGQLYY